MSHWIQQGFTLLELIVSIIIIGIILSFATLSIGDGGQSRRLKQEVQQLVTLLILASQEAVLQGKEIGVVFTKKNYYFFLWQDQEWRLLTQDEVFHSRALPAGMQINLSIEGEIVAVDDTTCEAPATCKPQLLLLSSGELTPFQLTLTAAGNVYQLTGTLTDIKYK